MNKHQQFIREAWPTLTGDTSEVEAIWREVVGGTMPFHETGHCLFLMGFWNFYRSWDNPPEDAVYSPNEYRIYLEKRFNKPEPGPEPELPTGSIFSDFLSHGYMTLLTPAFSTFVQTERMKTTKELGFKDIDIYGFNINDNPYNEFHWKVDASRDPDSVIKTFQLARQAGLRTTLWCFADELGGMSPDTAKDKLRKMIPELDPHVTRYVFALEQNESWDSDTVREILQVFVTLTEKDYYIHWTKGINAGTSYPRVTGIYYQYESTTRMGVVQETKDKIGKWHDAGKKFIAGEFPFSVVKNNPEEAKKLGDAVNDLVDGRACG